MKEEWRPAHIGYGVDVSSLGRVRRNGKLSRMKYKTGDYVKAHLQVEWRKMAFYVHRLMAFAFIGPPPHGKPLAAHKNDIRDDNRIENIYWASQKDNTSDSRVNGGLALGERVGTARLTRSDVLKIRSLHIHKRAGYDGTARCFGVSPSLISQIVNRVWWRHI